MQPLEPALDDVAAMAMENELLRYENRYLRARTAEVLAMVEKADIGDQVAGYEPGSLWGRSDEQAKARATRRSGQPEAVQKRETPSPEGDDDSAKQDLVGLLSRLDESPAGWLLRRRRGFRDMRERYLSDEGES